MTLNSQQIYEYLKSTDGSQRKITYADEQKLRHYVISGDPRALTFAKQIFNPDQMGKISSNPSVQYYFSACISETLFSRYCIEAGMPENIAFALSELFLQRLVPNMTRADIFQWHRDMVGTYLTLLPKFLQNNEEYRTQRQSSDLSNLVLDTIQYINQNLHTSLSLKTVASELYVTPDYLSHKFRSEVGVTYSQFVRTQKINAAKLMLEEGNITLSEIADNLSFCSQSYFTKVFREETGMTPNAYIKQLRRNES